MSVECAWPEQHVRGGTYVEEKNQYPEHKQDRRSFQTLLLRKKRSLCEQPTPMHRRSTVSNTEGSSPCSMLRRISDMFANLTNQANGPGIKPMCVLLASRSSAHDDIVWRAATEKSFTLTRGRRPVTGTVISSEICPTKWLPVTFLYGK